MTELSELFRPLVANAINRGYLQALEHALWFVENTDTQKAIENIKKMIENTKKEIAK